MATIVQTFEQTSENSLRQDLVQIVGSSLLIALCSQIKFILPFTIVPLTLQTLAVLLVGASLGSRKGAYAILCYYAQILMGLPVVSGGAIDPLIFIGPKGGYVMGWVVQAYLMGWFVEKAPFSKIGTLLVGGFVACSVQMAMGITVLAQFVGWPLALPMGLYPFIPGEILKVLFLTFSGRIISKT